MATTTSTNKAKPNNQSLTRSRSLGRKPKPEPEANSDGSERKTNEKLLPNYLKPTISSRPDPVKFLRKNNALDDNQKLLRRRSFDRPPSLTSQATSSSHKSLHASSAHPRDKPTFPRDKPVTGLRSTSFHGTSRGELKGSNTVKSHPVVSRGSSDAKKSGLSCSNSSKSKKEGTENCPKKSSGKAFTPKSSPLAPAHEDEDNVKVDTDVEVSNHTEEPEEEDKVHAEQPDESGEEKEIGPVDASTEEEKGELINEDKTEEQIEEPKELDNTQENKEEEEEIKKKADDEVNSETIATSTPATTDMKELVNVEDSKDEEKEEEEEENKEEESESSKVNEGTTETKAQAEDLSVERTKKEVLQGKKESPSAYNDVIASKIQENSKKNKVLALAGAFQTVIDYETAASK